MEQCSIKKTLPKYYMRRKVSVAALWSENCGYGIIDQPQYRGKRKTQLIKAVHTTCISYKVVPYICIIKALYGIDELKTINALMSSNNT